VRSRPPVCTIIIASESTTFGASATRSGISFSNNDQAAARAQRGAAVGEQAPRAGVVPVVQHDPEQQAVARGYGLEEVAADHPAAALAHQRLDGRQRLRDQVRQVVQDAARPRVRPQHLGQDRAAPAADVDDLAAAAEQLAERPGAELPRDRVGAPLGTLAHHRGVVRRHVLVGRLVRPDPRAEDALERGLAGVQRLG
jgi:hypothetical protein